MNADFLRYNIRIKTVLSHAHTLCPLQTQPADWDDGSHGSSEEDDFEEEDETPIAPVSTV